MKTGETGKQKTLLNRLVVFLREVDRRVIYGGSLNYRLRLVSQRRKGLKGLLDRIDQFIFGLLDRLDTAVLFQGRHIREKAGRVRSRKEREIAEALRELGIEYEYEKPLRVGDKAFRPDFFLPRYNVYIEYWGLAGSDPQYTAVMKAKQKFYSEHKVRVINIYPRHTKDFKSYLRKSIESLERQSKERR